MPRPSKPTKAASPSKKSPPAKKQQRVPVKATPAKKAAPTRATTAKKQPPVKSAPSSKQAPLKKQAPAKATTAKATTAKATTANATTAKATTTKAPAAKAPVPAKAAPAKKQVPVKQAPVKAAAPAKPAPPKKSPFDAKFLEAQKELLLQERDTYVSQAQALKAEADQLAAEMEPGDVQFDEESGEGGTANVDRERDLALSAQAMVAVEEIDFALGKIKANTYGLCESCGQPIMKARLQAIPHARLCVACKSGGLSRR